MSTGAWLVVAVGLWAVGIMGWLLLDARWTGCG